jgi:hypothetical protein
MQGSDKRKNVKRIYIANPDWSRPPVKLQHRWEDNYRSRV